MSSKLRRMCKLNYAVDLRVCERLNNIPRIARRSMRTRLYAGLDIDVCAAYFKLHTLHRCSDLDQARSKAGTSQASRRTESPSREGAGFLVPVERFFDARDLIQVKYEMLRHVSVDGASKADAAALFGMSRPTFYQAEAAFARDGLAGRSEAAWARGAQAQLRGNGVRRTTSRRRWRDSRSSTSRATGIRAGISVHPQHRTRHRAQNRRANRCRRPFRASLDCGLRGPTRCGDRRHPRAEGAALRDAAWTSCTREVNGGHRHYLGSPGAAYGRPSGWRRVCAFAGQPRSTDPFGSPMSTDRYQKVTRPLAP